MELKSKATLSNDFESSLNYWGKFRLLDFQRKKALLHLAQVPHSAGPDPINKKSSVNYSTLNFDQSFSLNLVT